jgi:glutamate N-acetyltransferase / amino-acid N-acetyltransferase
MSTKLDVQIDGGVTTPKGFLAGATYAGIKKQSQNALDLSILYSEKSCTTAAVFTTNKVKAAPVILDQNKLEKTRQSRAVVINSGCANACTGEQGMKAAIETSEIVAKKLDISSDEVMTASTGVIGVQLPMDKIRAGIGKIVLSKEGGKELTRAIMTTDTRPKSIAVKVRSGPAEFTIGGTCKGAGMIHPNMATMLGFLTSDASIDSDFLKSELKKAVDKSFNMVSVDGDTSTNDMVIIMCNGLANNLKITKDSDLADGFRTALQQVCTYLAKCIAQDGEGATRLIEIQVNGALNQKDAKLVARTISNSPLVKTAVHGCDPNWGRIIAAAGRSGASLIQNKADVYIGGMCLFKAGMPLPFNKKEASDLLNQDEVILRVDLNLGKANSTAWGCDLTNEYISINADYTT